jgi:Ca-activated chloride channel family protein
MRWFAVLAFLLLPAAARACELALVLAVDVSGSVDPDEYRIQRDGLALALRDPIVSESLVRSEAMVMVMQWTGSSRQKVTVPWTQVRTFDDAARLADRVAEDPRVWRNYSTAVGEALLVAEAEFASVPDCKRKVIDVSGDGMSNEGTAPVDLKSRLAGQGITVNAVVIDARDHYLTDWFFENVITGEGAFVVTAVGFEEYPRRIRQKLIRETASQVSWLR